VTKQADITVLLRRIREGNREAEEELYNAVYSDLLEKARRLMYRERPGHTLQSRDLVNELYLRLHFVKDLDWQDRNHFFAIATRSMRHFLIDYHKKWHKVQKCPLPPDELLRPSEWDLDLAVEIAKLLEQLKEHDPLLCTVVDMKGFLLMTNQEIARALDLSETTVRRRWHDARLWLLERLKN